jgi:hypothetical protein
MPPLPLIETPTFTNQRINFMNMVTLSQEVENF